MARGLIHYYFKNKEDMLEKLSGKGIIRPVISTAGLATVLTAMLDGMAIKIVLKPLPLLKTILFL